MSYVQFVEHPGNAWPVEVASTKMVVDGLLGRLVAVAVW
jgi:hypothetical protein